MKNDILFENSCLFSDLVLFAILCFTSIMGVATVAGQFVVGAGILLTGVLFVTLCVKKMNSVENHGHISHMHA